MRKPDISLAIALVFFGITGGGALNELSSIFPVHSWQRNILFAAEIFVALASAIWILFLLGRNIWSGAKSGQRAIVEKWLPLLDSQEKAWLRQMLTGVRPVGISDKTWQQLEQTGLVERDFQGPKGIVPELNFQVDRWFRKEAGENNKLIAALLMASGIFLFITGAVLFAERGTPIEIPVTTNSKPSIPSIILLYRNKQFEIHNTGPALSLWGTKVAYNEKVIEQQGRYIVTGAFYYLPAAHIDQQIVTALGPNGKGSLPLELYLQDPTPRRITVKFLLGVATQNGVVTINTQMLDVTDGW